MASDGGTTHAESVVERFAESAESLLAALRLGATESITKAEQLEQAVELLRTSTKAQIASCRESERAASVQLSTERADFANTLAEAERLNAINEQRVTLCVGGDHFTTTLATLQRAPGSMLGVMFSGLRTTALQVIMMKSRGGICLT